MEGSAPSSKRRLSRITTGLALLVGIFLGSFFASSPASGAPPPPTPLPAPLPAFALSLPTDAPCPPAPACPPALATPAALSWQSEALAGNDTLAAGSADAAQMAATVPAWLWVRGAGSSATRVLPDADVLASRYSEFANAQDNEDVRILERYMWGVAGGVILESGALDGIRISTSLLFARLFGWKAVHVDANPRNYARLIANRPDALNVHAAICARAQVVHWLAEEDPIIPVSLLKPAELERLSDTELAAPLRVGSRGPETRVGSGVGGIYEFMSPGFLSDFYPAVFAKHGTPAATESMPLVACRPLAPILALFGIAHVHVWVLDVEGAELQVLQAVDFSSVTFDVIVIEADGSNSTKDAGVIAFLTQRGFDHDGNVLRSDWFRRRGFEPRAKPV